MITRRAALAGGISLLVPPVQAEEQSLRSLAAAKGITFGCAAATYELRDADFPPLLAQQAGILVPEYEMKRNVTEPQPGAYDFSACDALMDFTRRHDMAMRGHCMVWYYANPPWLEEMVRTTRDSRLLTDYVGVLARRYRGRMQSWDVVNEALVPPEYGAKGWRPCFWLDVFGAAYLDMAFHAAHDADPGAALIYNDFGCEQGEAANDLFRRHTLELLDGLLKRRVPIQGLGLQGHLSAFGPKVDQAKLRAFLAEIEARGLSILVTEMDVDDEGGPADIVTRDRATADEAARFLDVVLDNKAVKTLLTWSLADRYLDPQDSMRLKLMGWRDRKVPYDRDLRPKPLRAALAQAFRAARPR
jgi:endo-1,4-beta-xylanase